MLIVDMNNLINRYYYTKNFKNNKEFFSIIKNSLNTYAKNLNLSTKEIILCFDPKEIKDKSWRYGYIENYKNNELQNLLYKIKEELSYNNNDDFYQFINDVVSQIKSVKEKNINALLKKWNINEQIKIDVYGTPLIENIKKLLERNTVTQKELNEKMKIITSLLNIKNISDMLKDFKFHVINNNQDIINEYKKFFKSKYNINMNYKFNNNFLNDYEKIENIINSRNKEKIEEVLHEYEMDKFTDKVLNNIIYDNVENSINEIYEEFKKEDYNVLRFIKLEADDIISQLTDIYSSKVDKIFIYSNDSDLEQLKLKYENVKIINNYKDIKEIQKNYNQKIILGDKSDNIPGVIKYIPEGVIRQIGKKTFENTFYQDKDKTKKLLQKIRNYVEEKLKKLDKSVISVLKEFDIELLDIQRIINEKTINFDNIPDEHKIIIDKFRKEYSFLSNMAKCNINYDGITYPSVEHFYIAMKVEKDDTTIIDNKKVNTRKYISTINSPAEAKKFGKTLKLRDNWNEIKVAVMKYALDKKFEQPYFKRKLLSTGNKYLIERNFWNDTFWGVCNGKGKNILGELLMNKRNEFQQEIQLIDKNLKKGLNVVYNMDFFNGKYNIGIYNANYLNDFNDKIGNIIKKEFSNLYIKSKQFIQNNEKELGKYIYTSIKNNNMKFLISLFTYDLDKNNHFNEKYFEKGMKNIIKEFINKRKEVGNKKIPIKIGFPANKDNPKEFFKVLKKLEKEFKNDNIIFITYISPEDKQLEKTYKKLEKENNLSNNNIER